MNILFVKGFTFWSLSHWRWGRIFWCSLHIHVALWSPWCWLRSWRVIGFLVDLNFGNISISSHPVALFCNIVSLSLIIIAHFCSGPQVSFLVVLEVHTVADQKVMRKASLVEFHVLLVVGILLLVEQILLGSLWDVITQKWVTLMELGLVLRNTSSCWLLHKLQNYENQAYKELYQGSDWGYGSQSITSRRWFYLHLWLRSHDRIYLRRSFQRELKFCMGFENL